MIPNQLRVYREIEKLRSVRPIGPNKHKVQETIELVIYALRGDVKLEDVECGALDPALVTENNKSAVREALKWSEDVHDTVRPPSESRFAILIQLNKR